MTQATQALLQSLTTDLTHWVWYTQHALERIPENNLSPIAREDLQKAHRACLSVQNKIRNFTLEQSTKKETPNESHHPGT